MTSALLLPLCEAAEMGKGREYHYYLIDNVQEEERGAKEVPPSPI